MADYATLIRPTSFSNGAAQPFMLQGALYFGRRRRCANAGIGIDSMTMAVIASVIG